VPEAGRALGQSQLIGGPEPVVSSGADGAHDDVPAAANRRNAPSVMPPAPISRSMSSSQTTEPWSVTSLAFSSANAVVVSGMATGRDLNSSAMTRAASPGADRVRSHRAPSGMTGRSPRGAPVNKNTVGRSRWTITRGQAANYANVSVDNSAPTRLICAAVTSLAVPFCTVQIELFCTCIVVLYVKRLPGWLIVGGGIGRSRPKSSERLRTSMGAVPCTVLLAGDRHC
jgi:hypothetical protein